MPHLNKIEARANQVFVSFREWDGIDRPDGTTLTLKLGEARGWARQLTEAITIAERNDEQLRRNRVNVLESEKRQHLQKLQAIADELDNLAAGLRPLRVDETSPNSAPEPVIVGSIVDTGGRNGRPGLVFQEIAQPQERPIG